MKRHCVTHNRTVHVEAWQAIVDVQYDADGKPQYFRVGKDLNLLERYCEASLGSEATSTCEFEPDEFDFPFDGEWKPFPSK